MVRIKQPDVFGWSGVFTVSGFKVPWLPTPRFFQGLLLYICTPSSLVQMTRNLQFEHMYLCGYSY